MCRIWMFFHNADILAGVALGFTSSFKTGLDVFCIQGG